MNWKNVDVSKGGILDYFIPLLRSDYENITKEKVCASEELPDVLGYPQVSLVSVDFHLPSSCSFTTIPGHRFTDNT